MQAILLGCGYTGLRVAERLLERGVEVLATARDVAHLQSVAGRGAGTLVFDAQSPTTINVEAGAVVLCSIPVIDTPEGPVDVIPRALMSITPAPGRVVYLSTTGVYGDAFDVDETTPVQPRSDREQRRVDAEEFVLDGPWSGLVLRPAAIYGPGRGIQASFPRFQLAGDGSNYVSRIHVDDLAEHAIAGLFSGVTGAYPVADEHPCTSREIAEFCAALLHQPMPPSAPREQLHTTRRANRRVDGSAIRRLLGVTLRYPSYRTGIPNSL